MKTLDELREYYDTDLKLDLADFERQRQKIVTHSMIVFGALAGAGVLVALFLMLRGLPPVILLFILIGCAIIGGVYYYIAGLDYRSGFKRIILPKLIAFVEPGLEYRPEQGISKELFRAAGLFLHSIDRYKCEDMIQGKVGKTEIAFSEVHAEYKTTSGSGKNRRTEWHTIFKGLFFIADFNKDFHGRTVVLPDTAEKLFGLFGQTLQSWNSSYGQLVRLEDVEFEKEFVVYGTDQIEARYILSPALMERILLFGRKAGKKIYLSFLGSKVFVAIPVQENMFEPKVFSSILDFNVIAEYYAQLQLGVGIVDELNLNTRIWTKE
ncbi:MAG: DUF3137 domain-containing protein [Planctomycetes bacterium]|nr:DUF3137 domain-containing protein [Planctomycetota bacterium]